MGLNTEFANLWDEYVEDLICNIGGELDEEGFDDLVYSDELKDAIENDLEDKGFSKEESQLLSCENGYSHKETLYKILAYLLLLYDNFNNKQELIKIIESHYITNIDNYTDEDLDKIVLFRNKIDY